MTLTNRVKQGWSTIWPYTQWFT